MKTDLIDYLSRFVSENRCKKFNEVLAQRTRHITIVLEDIYQSHNASAVLRSCDCFGIQNVHIIENRNNYTVNPDVALGASKWLNLYKYNQLEENTLECLQTLKKNGYRIVATSPHEDGEGGNNRYPGNTSTIHHPKRPNYLISELPLEEKTALVFGTELKGISDIVIEQADAFVKIPMYGFTESFNISVSAALCLYEVSRRLRSSPTAWQLINEEREELLLDWLRQSITKPELIEEEFMRKQKMKDSV